MDNSERIAAALERIADALESRQRRVGTRIASQHTRTYLELLERNRDRLHGRMTAPQIIEAIGATVEHRDRAAFGDALTQFGVIKGRNGRQRYYVFAA